MNGSVRLDPRIGRYLAESPGDLPLATHRAIADATLGLAQQPGRVTWPARRQPGRLANAMVPVAATLAVVALTAGLLGAGALLDRTRVPVASPNLPVVGPPTPAPTSPTPAGTPEPTPTPTSSAPAGLDSQYASTRYAYSIGHPSNWTVTPATRSWPGDGTWTRQPYADVIAPLDGRTRLSVVAMVVPSTMTVDGAIARFLPHRREVPSRGIRYCPGGTPAAGGWLPTVIGGRPGSIRQYCGYTEGVVSVGRRIYVITLVLDGRGVRDQASFEAFARSMTVRPDEPIETDETPAP